MNWMQKLSIPFLVIGVLVLTGNVTSGTFHLGGPWYAIVSYVVASNIFLIIGGILLVIGSRKRN